MTTLSAQHSLRSYTPKNISYTVNVKMWKYVHLVKSEAYLSVLFYFLRPCSQLKRAEELTGQDLSISLSTAWPVVHIKDRQSPNTGCSCEAVLICMDVNHHVSTQALTGHWWQLPLWSWQWPNLTRSEDWDFAGQERVGFVFKVKWCTRAGDQ